MKKIFSSLIKEILRTSIAAVMMLVVFVGAVAATSAFSPPTQNPPSGNAYAPVNIGASTQNKAGNFFANNLVGRNDVCAGTGAAQKCLKSVPASMPPAATVVDTSETVRIVRGRVQGTNCAIGSLCPILLGSGVSSARRTAKGVYEIIFSDPFLRTPVVTATVNYIAVNDPSGLNAHATINSITNNKVTVYTNSGDNNDKPYDFDFIAIGN